EQMERGKKPENSIRARFAGPVPRVAEAHWLRDRGAKALIDLSDGLVADAGQIAAASGVACVIEAARVPVCDGAEQEAALLGGEEFELLAALPEENVAELSSMFEEAFGFSLTGIGHVEDGSGVRVMNAGMPLRLSGGFRHFES
ncbi:thiamine-monophosphate kinase, partial [Gemmatimonadota bacterium]